MLRSASFSVGVPTSELVGSRFSDSVPELLPVSA